MKEDVVYWDASALVSLMVGDIHSPDARARARAGEEGTHLISSLAEAECHAVLARMCREGLLTVDTARAAAGILDERHWTRLIALPRLSYFFDLVSRWPLKGADLWHLALAKTLREKMPTIFVLTYDDQLRKAAKGEGLAP